MTWNILGESVAGTSHLFRNIPCQDSHQHRVFGESEGWLCIAVADGAGSSLHSDIGAKLACEEVVRLAVSHDPNILLQRDGMVELFAEVRMALLSQAEALSLPPRELACTLLVALLGPDSAAFAQIGDGAVVVGDAGNYRVAFWPEPQEYANCTDFLTDEKFRNTIHFETRSEAISELAAFTDGLQRLALDFETKEAFPGFFAPLFRPMRNNQSTDSLVEPFRNFLNSERVNERTDDDKTLVIACRQP